MTIKREPRTKIDYFELIDKTSGLPLDSSQFELRYHSSSAGGDDGDPWGEAYSDELQAAALEQNFLGVTLVQANWVENVGLAQWEYTLANAAIKAIHNATVQQTRASQQVEAVTFTSGGSTSAGSIIIAVSDEPTVDIDVDIFLKESEVLD